MERLKRPESRRMAQPWQVSKRLRGLRRLKGSFGPLEKKDLARQSPEPTACATPPTVSQSPEPTVWQVRGFGASEASRIQKLAAPTASMAEPLARFEGFEGFQGTTIGKCLRGLRGLRGLRRLKGSFGPLEKKDLARQSPEPTACATPPTVSQSPEPTVWQARGFGASEASRIQKLAAPTASMAHSLAQSPEPTV